MPKSGMGAHRKQSLKSSSETRDCFRGCAQRNSRLLHLSHSTSMKMPELLPPPDTMYRALLNRDSSFEGIFYAGVRTTGIFCRPTCTAKKPERVNVDFFATPIEALHSGYRPCR